MSVITLDILVEGIRRDDVLTWLSEFENHTSIMDAAFPKSKTTSENVISLPIQAGWKARTLEYNFIGKDDSHGGRRVLVTTKGKRMEGSLHYSLRTMKPSSNTMVTLHMDYNSGGVLGTVLKEDIQKNLEKYFKRALEQVKHLIEKDLNS